MIARTREKRGGYEAALDALDRALQEIEGGGGEAAEEQHAEILTWRGWIELDQGHPQSTLRWSEAALERLARAGRERSAVAALALNNIGAAYQTEGDLDAAASWYARSLELYEVLEDPVGCAMTWHNLGAVAHARGNVEAALADYRRALEVRERIGDRRGAAQSASNIGVIQQDRGELAAAADTFATVLEHFASVGDSFGEAASRLNLGVVHRLAGRLDEALALGEAAAEAFAALNMPLGLAYVHAHLGATLLRLGDLDGAETRLLDATRIRREHDLWDDGAEPWLALVELYAARGDLERAHAAVAEAERIAEQTAAGAWRLLARITRLRLLIPRDPAAAARALRDLLPEADAIQHAQAPVAARAVLAKALASAGDPAAARSVALEALALAEARGLDRRPLADLLDGIAAVCPTAPAPLAAVDEA